MTTTTTGTGLGSSGKYTTRELAILAKSMTFLVAGRVDAEEDIMINPPTPSFTVTLDPPLPGSYTNYVVIVSGLNTGSIYIATMDNDADGNFDEFTGIAEDEGTCMYAIMKVGIKPTI